MGFKLRLSVHVHVQGQLPRLQMLTYKLVQGNAF